MKRALLSLIVLCTSCVATKNGGDDLHTLREYGVTPTFKIGLYYGEINLTSPIDNKIDVLYTVRCKLDPMFRNVGVYHEDSPLELNLRPMIIKLESQ